MPEFFVAIRSGHELTSLSALYEYLGATLVLTMPSAVALGGWSAFQWGQTGVGPSFPSLDVLLPFGVSLDQLEIVMNAMYNLHDESPPMFQKDGALRKTLRTTFATQLMYFEERWTAVEMRDVQVCLRPCAHTHTHARPRAHTHTFPLSVSSLSLLFFSPCIINISGVGLRV
jgi:hypothetical protein